MATILYIDHNEAAQKVMQTVLGRQYNMVSAGDGPTAIQYCAMIQPDLILMDIELPDIDEYELVERLKMFMPATPILLLATDGRDIQQLQTSVDWVLIKPVNTNDLKHRVKIFLPGPPVKSTFAISSEQIADQFESQITALNQANKRLASLNAISALIGTSLDLEHLTDEILNQIQRSIEFDSATLFLLKGNILEAAASRGFLDHQRGMNIYDKSDRNSAWQVVNNKLPLIINDIATSEHWEPRPELARVQSWLGVPLIYKDRVVGVLTLDKNEAYAFSEADAHYMFTLTYQIAIAVENAQLFQEWENQATRLKLINEMAREITTILDTNDLFDALTKVIYDRLRYDRVSVFELNQNYTDLILKAQYGQFPSQDMGDIYKPDPDDPLVKQVLETSRPVLVNNVSQKNIVDLTDTDVWSALIMPIIAGTHIEAVIAIENNAISGFKDPDLWTLSSLASQAATVITNAKLYQDVDAYSDKLERIIAARTERLQAIKKISRVVSQGLEVNDLLTVVSQDISQIFTSDDPTLNQANVTIGLVNGAYLIVRMIYDGQQKKENTELSAELTYKIDHTLPVGVVIDQSRPIILNNIPPQAIYNAVSDESNPIFNSILVAPLITAGKTIGIIMVESQQSNVFDESDLETLEALAFQVASAIEYARLLRKTRELAIVDERTRLARDMHDGVAQNLAYLLIQVDRCLNMVDENSKVENQLEHIGQLLTQNIEELRRNIFDLRPVDLEGKPLFKVLENFVIEFGQRWNLQTRYYVEGEINKTSATVERTLYRILQETLSNARQHAQCTQIIVRLSATDQQYVSLTIEDNGRGFDTNNPYPKKGNEGLGLVSMRERAENIGGEFMVDSDSRQGTRIFAQLPLQAVTNRNKAVSE